MARMSAQAHAARRRLRTAASPPPAWSRSAQALNDLRATPRARRRLLRIRAEIAQAEARLSVLRAEIREARSDTGMAAAQGMQARNEQLAAANLLATQEMSATRTALDATVRASQIDPLTGLSNRTVLWDRLSHALDVAGRQGHRVAVYLLDVDHFKQLNDAFGHSAGDLVLQRVASVLSGTLRASDTICRLGGDEFVVVTAELSPHGVDQLARKIEDRLGEPFLIAGRLTTLSTSIGFSVFPDDGRTPQALVQRADEAMYRVKRASGGAPGPR